MILRPTRSTRTSTLFPYSTLFRAPAALLKRVEMLEILLERSFTIPGINRAVGLDAIVGLVPVVGDLITAAMGAYLVWEARNLGMPKDRKSTRLNSSH